MPIPVMMHKSEHQWNSKRRSDTRFPSSFVKKMESLLRIHQVKGGTMSTIYMNGNYAKVEIDFGWCSIFLLPKNGRIVQLEIWV